MLNQTLYALSVFALLSTQAVAETPRQSNNGRFIAESRTGQWQVSKLLGLRIYNEKNEHIGSISEVLIDNVGKIEVVVISVGGLLAKRDIAVAFNEIKASNENAVDGKSGKNKQDHLQKDKPSPGENSEKAAEETSGTPPFGVLMMTNEELTAAPDFKRIQ